MKTDLVIVGRPFAEMQASIPKEIDKVHVVDFSKEKGYNAALNEGAEMSNADVIGFCNNDLEFTPNSVRHLMAGLERFDSVSPWCPLTHHQWWGNTKPIAAQEGTTTGKLVAGWCIFTKRKTWETIGGFDERLKFWCSDNAYSEQLNEARLSHALIPSARVKHLQSQTLNKLPRHEYDELTKQQVRLFNKLYNKNLFNLGKA